MIVFAGIIKIILLILIGVVFVWTMMMLIKQSEIKSLPFTLFQKIKQSFIGGCMVSISVLSVFAIIFVLGWIVWPAQVNFQSSSEYLRSIFTMIVCFGIPAQIMGTVGTFSQLTYMGFLLDRSGKK